MTIDKSNLAPEDFKSKYGAFGSLLVPGEGRKREDETLLGSGGGDSGI